MLTAAEYTCLQPLDGRVSGWPKETMARLLDLPDEVLAMIPKYFEVTAQHSPYLRRSVEVDEADSHNRRDLSAFTRVCKRLQRVTAPLLEQHRYLDLDTLRKTNMPYHDIPSELNHVMDRLARLSFCKNLVHLICKLNADILTSFLICLSNASTAATLTSLSLAIYGDGRSIQLQSLSKFPKLSGLEIIMWEDVYIQEIYDKTPFVLPSLKDLQCGMNRMDHMASILSLVPLETLDTLGIYYNIPEDIFEDIEEEDQPHLWPRSWNNKCLRGLRNLSVLVGRYVIPPAMRAEIPVYFPSLDTFDINYEHGLPSDQYETFLASHPVNTSITISPYRMEHLKVLLLCIKEQIKLPSRLQAITIGLQNIKPIEQILSPPGMVQLWNEAQTAASSSGVEFRPADLTEAVEGLLEERRDRRERRNRRSIDSDIDSDEA